MRSAIPVRCAVAALCLLSACRLLVEKDGLSGGVRDAGRADVAAEAGPKPGGLASITITPSAATVAPGRTQQFAAVGKDAAGNAISPAPSVTWGVTTGGTIDGTGLFTAGAAAGVAVVTAELNGIRASANVTIASGSLTIGETTLLNEDDSGNANYLLAQEVTLPTPATIRSITLYIAQAAGNVRFGIYDATGPDGGPGAKKAETAEVAAAAGWNPVPVTTPVLLPAGTYWLAYTPNDDNLHFNRAGDGTGKIAYYMLPYGPMPATFSTTPTTQMEHWSFYATLTP